MSQKRLTRSTSNKMIAGVCAGLASYLNLDPTIVRVAYVLLSIFTVFAGVIVYIILWLLIPEQ